MSGGLRGWTGTVAVTNMNGGLIVAEIIIHKADDITDYDALLHVQAVIRGGRVSKDGKSYCYVTTFHDGIIVYADKKKADIFTVKRKSEVV